MAKFNRPKIPRYKTPDTTNYEGGPAWEYPPEVELLRLSTACLLKDRFYESEESTVQRLLHTLNAVAQKEPEFPFKIAAYGRQVFNLRSIPLLILVACSQITQCREAKGLFARYGPAILRRADEPAEAIACHYKFFGKHIPHALRKAINAALAQFNEYQLGKHRKAKADVSLRDVVRICHPKHTELMAKIAKNELAVPET